MNAPSTIAPRIMRYQPKTAKLCFFMKPVRNFIAATETTNAISTPTMSTISSDDVNENPNLSILRRLAPSMTGIAMKNENSAAASRDIPRIIAPRMVEPEREVPGMS